MKNFIKRLIYHNLPKSVIDEIRKPYKNSTVCYSQEGEDILLNRIFEGQLSGFYVDIGAHHPTRFSNTYLFYLKGWKGINIDAMPGSMQAFYELRPNDINLELGVSMSPSLATFYVFNEKALNTFDKTLASEYSIKWGKPHELSVKTLPLSTILDKYLPSEQCIDFMSIDVEGLDLEVLKSNNWKKYSPSILLVECLSQDFKSIHTSEIDLFLTSKGYSVFAKTFNTTFYKRSLDV